MSAAAERTRPSISVRCIRSMIESARLRLAWARDAREQLPRESPRQLVASLDRRIAEIEERLAELGREEREAKEDPRLWGERL